MGPIVQDRISGSENQKNSRIRRLWRSRRRKSGSVPAGVANFPAAVFLAGNQGPLNGGVSNGGVSRSGLFCPSFFVLFCPFWDFPDFSGIFPICSGVLQGFSRFVPFLFLGLLRAPTRNSPERVRDTIWTFPEKINSTLLGFLEKGFLPKFVR